MPAMEQANRTQKAVLWPATGVNEDGQPTVDSPIELTVRWNTKRREAVDSQGNPIALDAFVVVDREIDVGSAMWLGALNEWLGTGSAGNESGVMEVLTYNETPDLKGRDIRRTVGLAFYKDAPPELTV